MSAGQQNVHGLVIESCCHDTRVCWPAVCAELRGDSSYLFGLRVAEEARGKGVASQLLVRQGRRQSATCRVPAAAVS
jgi:GNAT superfamily N-acetyltransferase